VKTKLQTRWNLIDRNNHRPSASVIAQQYSSANFVLMRSHSRKKEIRLAFQKKSSFASDIFKISKISIS
jgi:hypothetical protein